MKVKCEAFNSLENKKKANCKPENSHRILVPNRRIKLHIKNCQRFSAPTGTSILHFPISTRLFYKLLLAEQNLILLELL